MLPLSVRAPRLPMTFPFREKAQAFLKEYANCPSYWYVPKVRAINDENVLAMQAVLHILDEHFQERFWDAAAQADFLAHLHAAGIVDQVVPGTQNDKNALVRIWKVALELFGLMWVDDNTDEIIITPAGAQLIAANPKRTRGIVEAQVAKLQYPWPGLTPAAARAAFEAGGGIVPHLFLLQVLQRTEYWISREEYILFLNLAQSHDDLDRIVGYIKMWRDLTPDEQAVLHDLARPITMPFQKAERFNRIALNSSYSLGALCYPSYLQYPYHEDNDPTSYVMCTAPEVVDELVADRVPELKVTIFDSMEEWIAYVGDPDQKPSWFTWLIGEIDKAETVAEAEKIVKEYEKKVKKKKLAPDDEEAESVQKQLLEKQIEDFYSKALDLLEPGLKLVPEGRQYQTPIGRMDLLCIDPVGQYVVVEVKVGEAEDAVFGQVLRYMGWVHRNMDNGEDNVRSIILAGNFSEKARYSRIGLLTPDYKQRIKFKKHGFELTDV